MISIQCKENTFYERLKLILNLSNKTLPELYTTLNIPRSTVANWKKGFTPTADKLLLISEFLDVNPYALLNGKINMSKEESDLRLKQKLLIQNKIELLEKNNELQEMLINRLNNINYIHIIKCLLNYQLFSITDLKLLSEILSIPFSEMFELSNNNELNKNTIYEKYSKITPYSQLLINKMIEALFFQETTKKGILINEYQ